MKAIGANRRISRVTGGMAAACFLLLLTSIAWACTSQPVLGPPGSSPAGSGLDPSSGPPNLFPVKVEGSAFQPGPVSIRWNSVDGRQLATASGPNFSVEVRIPADAQPGVFYVVAFQRDTFGNVSSLARAPFEVTPVEREPVPGGLSAGGASGATASAFAGGTTSLTTEGGNDAEPTGQSQGSLGATTARQPASPAGQGGEGPGSSAPPGQSAVTAPQTAPASSTGLQSGPLDAVVRPGSSRAVTSDLWSAFERGGLRPGLPDVAPAEPLPTALIAGSALLGVGILALVAGFVFAEGLRRRRVAMAGDK